MILQIKFSLLIKKNYSLQYKGFWFDVVWLLVVHFEYVYATYIATVILPFNY